MNEYHYSRLTILSMEIAGIFLYPRPVLALHLRHMPALQALILFYCLIAWRLRGFSFIPGLSWPCISVTCLRHRLRCPMPLEIAGILPYPWPCSGPASPSHAYVTGPVVLFCCLIPWRLQGFSFIPGLSWPCISVKCLRYRPKSCSVV